MKASKNHFYRAVPLSLSIAVSLAVAGAGMANGVTQPSAEPKPHMTVSPNPVTSTQPSEVTIQGSRYATSNKGSTFGGAYILFGTVTPKDPNDPTSWAPSKRGVPGTNYAYAAGLDYQTMVNYPGNTTEEGLPYMDSEGNWTATLRIPGPVFKTNNGQEIDCLKVRCGIITIGAHGRANAGVEAFEPVSFGEPEPTPTEKPEPTSGVTITAVPVPSSGPGTPGPAQPPALPVTGGQGIGLAGLTVAAITGGAVLMRRRQTH